MRARSKFKEGGLRRMAINMMSWLYFCSDPIDKLPFLLRSWAPATFSRAHLAALAELQYMTFKVPCLSTPLKACLTPPVPMQLLDLRESREGIEKMSKV